MSGSLTRTAKMAFSRWLIRFQPINPVTNRPSFDGTMVIKIYTPQTEHTLVLTLQAYAGSWARELLRSPPGQSDPERRRPHEP